jgi:DNA-binding CsgD family transcriptional regulator/PAS domain-containing protein
MRSWNLASIEEAFTAAAIDPGQWSAALELAARQTESRGALLLPIRGDRLPNSPASQGVARATESYFRDGWHLRDERFRGVAKMIKTGVIDDFDCLPADLIKRNPFYQELLVPAGLCWFAGVRMGQGDDVWCLSIQRGIRQAPFTPDEKAKLSKLSLSLEGVVMLAKALGDAAATATLEAFEVSNTAVLLLNRQGEVIRANRSAERLLCTELRISAKRLRSMDSTVTAELDRSLQELVWSEQRASLMQPIAMPRSDDSPILAYPLKLPGMSASPLGDAQAAIVLVDPSVRRHAPLANLQSAFRLTTAEARLACGLASGDSLEASCEALGIAKETGRNHLKSIFSKTGTHRQSELVLMMARML